MINRFLAIAAVLAVIVLFGTEALYAQDNGQSQQQQSNEQSNDQQVDWNQEWKYAQAENHALKSILGAIQSIDTARQSELIQFIITDRSVRSRVISALRKAGYNISPTTNADMVVTQKPGSRADLINGDYQNDLLRIVVQSVGVYGAPTLKRILGQELYDKINNRSDFEYTLVSVPNAQQSIQYADINASFFGGSIVFKSGFGFGIDVGNDYIGYPFWVPGNVGVEGLIHKEKTDVKVGLNFQLGEAGIQPFSISGGLRIKERKLEGTQGFNAMINQMLDVFSSKDAGRLSIGGEFFQAFNPSINTLSSRAAIDPQYRTDYGSFTPKLPGVNKDSLYYLGVSGHAWLEYSFAGALGGTYIEAGAGTHRINALTIGEKGTKYGEPGFTDIIQAQTYDHFDPLIKIGYNHTGSNGYDWGVSLQYCNMLLADGFIQVFDWLDLEAKYSTVVGRDPEKWEWSDFVMISPVLHLNF